jgi:hypothetical protein
MSRQPSRKQNRQQPKGDRRPSWWRTLSRRLDLPGQVAERLENRWQHWWGPVILLSFPILLVILAFIITSLR